MGREGKAQSVSIYWHTKIVWCSSCLVYRQVFSDEEKLFFSVTFTCRPTVLNDRKHSRMSFRHFIFLFFVFFVAGLCWKFFEASSWGFVWWKLDCGKLSHCFMWVGTLIRLFWLHMSSYMSSLIMHTIALITGIIWVRRRFYQNIFTSCCHQV